DFNQKHFPGVPQQGITDDGFSTLQAQLATAETDLQTALDQRKEYERSLAEHKDLKLAASSPLAPVQPSAPPAAAAPAAPVADPPPSLDEQKLAQRRSELAALLTRYT